MGEEELEEVGVSSKVRENNRETTGNWEFKNSVAQPTLRHQFSFV